MILQNYNEKKNSIQNVKMCLAICIKLIKIFLFGFRHIIYSYEFFTYELNYMDNYYQK